MEKPNRDRVLDHWYEQEVLTVDGIITIHDEIIELYGGFSGVMKSGELDFVVDQVNYESEDVYWNTALILRNITSNHPFVDGNKTRERLLKLQRYIFVYITWKSLRAKRTK